MLRRLMLAALALCAFLALEGCGASRLTGPSVANDKTPVVEKQPAGDPIPPTPGRTDDGLRRTGDQSF